MGLNIASNATALAGQNTELNRSLLYGADPWGHGIRADYAAQNPAIVQGMLKRLFPNATQEQMDAAAWQTLQEFRQSGKGDNYNMMYNPLDIVSSIAPKLGNGDAAAWAKLQELRDPLDKRIKSFEENAYKSDQTEKLGPKIGNAVATSVGYLYGGPLGAAAANTASNKYNGADWNDALKSGAIAGVTTWAGGQLKDMASNYGYDPSSLNDIGNNFNYKDFIPTPDQLSQSLLDSGLTPESIMPDALRTGVQEVSKGLLDPSKIPLDDPYWDTPSGKPDFQNLNPEGIDPANKLSTIAPPPPIGNTIPFVPPIGPLTADQLKTPDLTKVMDTVNNITPDIRTPAASTIDPNWLKLGTAVLTGLIAKNAGGNDSSGGGGGLLDTSKAFEPFAPKGFQYNPINPSWNTRGLI